MAETKPSAPSASALFAAARQPRMIGFLVLLLAVAFVCGLLGRWQLDRAQLRGEQAETERRAELAGAAPVDLLDALVPGQSFAAENVGRRVVVVGEYLPQGQLLVVDRIAEQDLGRLVLTPLQVSAPGSPHDGSILPVVRGWIPEETAPDGSSPALTAPTGQVEVAGFLQSGEAMGDLFSEGLTDSISPAALVNYWGGPGYTGYLVQSAGTPQPDAALTLLPMPTNENAGFNLRNLFYALQWWLFGGAALALWVRLVRDDAQDFVEAQAQQQEVSNQPIQSVEVE